MILLRLQEAEVRNQKYKLALYADIILMLSNPKEIFHLGVRKSSRNTWKDFRL